MAKDKTYWIARDGENVGGGVYLCTGKPAWSPKRNCWKSNGSHLILLHEDNNTQSIAPGEGVEVRLKFERVEGISTAQTKAAKKKRLEGRIGE